MSVEESPEFLKALYEVCGKKNRTWLYGGTAVTAEDKSKIDGVMKEIQQRSRGVEEMRKSLALRATAMGLDMSGIPGLPDEITPESMDQYNREMEKYSDKIRTEAERERNPHVQEITRNLWNRRGSSGLVCPVCGEGDHGNKDAGGKAICYMINKHKAKGVDGPVLLMSAEKAKDWEPPKSKVKPRETWELDEDEIVKVRRKKKRPK